MKILTGEKITMQAGRLKVPDFPVIPDEAPLGSSTAETDYSDRKSVV